MAHERILIADDETDSRARCQLALEGAGFQVLEAADAAQMLTLAQVHRPQLILADLLMPGMDGFEAVATLQRQAATASIPILYLSTLAPEEALAQGVAHFVTKPFEREGLMQAVRHVVKAARPGGEPPRILVVDDERDIVEIVCDYLADAGYQGIGAYDGQEAISAIEQQTPAAVILDIKMPVLDGYAVIRWVKRHPIHRRIPIIVLTATRLLRLNDGGVTRHGPLATVPKPCEPAQLVAAVQGILHAT